MKMFVYMYLLICVGNARVPSSNWADNIVEKSAHDRLSGKSIASSVNNKIAIFRSKMPDLL